MTSSHRIATPTYAYEDKSFKRDRRRKLTGNCEDDCQERCAYPGQFSECDIGFGPR